MVQITHLGFAPNHVSTLVVVSTPSLANMATNGETYRRWQRRMQSYRRPTYVGGENTRSPPFSHHCKTSSCRYNNRRNNSEHSNPGQSRHDASQHPHGNAGGVQHGGPAVNASTVFQPQQGVPPAPSSGTQAPGMRYGSVLKLTPTDANRELFGPTY